MALGASRRLYLISEPNRGGGGGGGVLYMQAYMDVGFDCKTPRVVGWSCIRVALSSSLVLDSQQKESSFLHLSYQSTWKRKRKEEE